MLDVDAVQAAVQNFPRFGSEKKSKSIELIPPPLGHVPFSKYVANTPRLDEDQLWDEFVAHERQML